MIQDREEVAHSQGERAEGAVRRDRASRPVAQLATFVLAFYLTEVIPFHSDHDMNLGGSLCIVIPAKAGIHSNLVSYNTPTLLRIGITSRCRSSRSEHFVVQWTSIRWASDPEHSGGLPRRWWLSVGVSPTPGRYGATALQQAGVKGGDKMDRVGGSTA